MAAEEKGAPKVGIVEDDSAVRAFFAAAIARGGLDVAFAAGSLGEALAAIRAGVPDLCLVDLGLPDGSGVDFITELKTRSDAKALVSTVFGDRATVLRALRAGADGYILKSLGEADLLHHVRQTLDGFTPVSPQVATYLLEILKTRSAGVIDPRDALTDKETEILTVFGRGLTYAETAATLGLSANTIRDYVKKIYAKLNVHSRTEALFEARSLGIIRPSTDDGAG